MDPVIEARMRREHYDKYERLAQEIGLSALKILVPFKRDQIVAALATDRNMNNLPLVSWDMRHKAVFQLWSAARRAGRAEEPGGWSLANSVCVLKHVARHHVAGDPAPVDRDEVTS